MSSILFNNQQIPTGERMTVRQLLLANGLNPAIVMIRVNGQVVSREQYASFIIPDGATVKAYPFVGGG